MAGHSKFLIALCFVLLATGCAQDDPRVVELNVPRGYVSLMEIELEGGRYRFGPFVGYYFRPHNPKSFSRLQFLCFNEKGFYTEDMAVNAMLFQGEAVLVKLPETGFPLPVGEERIQPVFFSEAPKEWLETRPAPKDEFVHFHSCYNARGPVHHGYWLRHVAQAEFTYDMGGRVGTQSALYHRVHKGVDREFARIIEFDKGPQ